METVKFFQVARGEFQHIVSDMLGKTIEPSDVFTDGQFLSRVAYEAYRRDWCNQRGYPFDEVAAAEKNDEEYEGQMYVCQSEFEDCEMQDDEYMEQLLGSSWQWMKNIIQSAE